MKTENESENNGIEAMKELSHMAEEHGIADMTLDEINAEIEASRIERCAISL